MEYSELEAQSLEQAVSPVTFYTCRFLTPLAQFGCLLSLRYCSAFYIMHKEFDSAEVPLYVLCPMEKP